MFTRAKYVEALVSKEKKFYEDYEKDKEEFYNDPSNKGLSYPACIHGTSYWTSYDNICGACEAGYNYFNEEVATEDAVWTVDYAMDRAHARRKEFLKFLNECNGKDKTGPKWDAALIALEDWAQSPIEDLNKLSGLK